MNLPKAIEIGTDILNFVKPGDPPDEHDTLKLLIEAGKRVEHGRLLRHLHCLKLLPGETKD